MAEPARPRVYSIAAHRGFADALVAGLVPRYADDEFGLARLTLLLPSSRAARTVSEAFIRHAGESGRAGLLMPRMALVGDLDLDETLGALIDPLGASDIPPAVEPTRRWLELAELLRVEIVGEGKQLPPDAALLRLAREIAATMDRLLAEQVAPEDLLGEAVLHEVGASAGHWQDSIRRFARVQQHWRLRLDERGEVDAATRRNLLFGRAARQWREAPPATPIVAAGVTSAAPALARLLRVIADLPQGAVILPDLDLDMDQAAWDELGRCGQADAPGGAVFARGDAVTHPQYHLKLLLNRMGVARGEVMPWYRRGISAAEPARSHAISSLFLPPRASRAWIDLDASKRRLSGVRLIESATREEEAQAIALLVREALEEPEKRVAVVSPDRALARRVAQHLARWNIAADDSAGRPLSLTPAGRLLLQLAQVAAEEAAPVALIAALAHPLVRRGDARREWLVSLRAFELRLRGPRPAGGLAPLREIADRAGVRTWWDALEPLLAQLHGGGERIALAEALERLIAVGEALAGTDLWAREDGRALARMIEDIRLHAAAIGLSIAERELANILREAMDQVAVRPPWGGHPRVAIYGLLESRMARADLVICGGLNEGSWPGVAGSDALLAPAVLRVLGVPGADFRIGLAAHDLAGAMGAPEVVLTRARRDKDGPTIPSRFLSRIEALLGDLAGSHRELAIPAIARHLDRLVEPMPAYERPAPDPSAALRDVPIKVTGLDRLLGDPYQFYASEILRLGKIDQLDAEVTPAWQGTLVHRILERWHNALGSDVRAALIPIAEEVLGRENLHPMIAGLWRPRLFAALEWIERSIREQQGRSVIGAERKGEMIFDGVRIYGRADRIDRLDDGTLAIVDYKTGQPPSAARVAAGYALQLGLLGLIARYGAFEGLSGPVSTFEYWSLAKKNGEFGYVDVPMKVGRKTSGLLPEEFLPKHEEFLKGAISRFIKGCEPFTARLNPDYPGYNDYDQLMRLDEWQMRSDAEDVGRGA